MELKVTAVGNIKQGQYGPYGSVKSDGNVWYVIDGDPTQYRGKTLSGTVQDKGKFKVFKLDFVVDEQPKPQTNGAAHPDPLAPKEHNGKISSMELAAFMKFIGNVAKEIEPDQPGTEHNEATDRSRARSAILNTCVIAFKEGKIDFEMPPEDEKAPF